MSRTIEFIRKAFDNIYKLLRPGGKGLFMLLSWNDGFDVYKKLYANPRYRPYMQVIMFNVI